MENLLNQVSDVVAVACGLMAVACVAVGALLAFLGAIRAIGSRQAASAYRQTWLRFAIWLILALEFALAADIAATVFAPDWTEIGQLAAIAAIRTVLNLFLERDLEAGRRGLEPEPST